MMSIWDLLFKEKEKKGENDSASHLISPNHAKGLSCSYQRGLALQQPPGYQFDRGSPLLFHPYFFDLVQDRKMAS
jgi:hypothetical protein